MGTSDLYIAPTLLTKLRTSLIEVKQRGKGQKKLYNAACILHCTFDRGIKVGWMEWYACMHVRCMQYRTIIQTSRKGSPEYPRGMEVWLDECMHACRLFIEWIGSGFGSLFGSYFHPLFSFSIRD